MSFEYQIYRGDQISEPILTDAARLFSENYGVWGLQASSKLGTFAKAGRRIRMSSIRLKQQCLPPGADNIYIRAVKGEKLVGNVFATRWVHQGRRMCWIAQLVVSSYYRNLRIATELLRKLQEQEQGEEQAFGILSSHPFAIRAALRAFGHGLEKVNLSMTQKYAATTMASCPIVYVREAKLRGSLFGESGAETGVKSCADTKFYVDHQEPVQALNAAKQSGLEWPLGDLPEGHEFLLLIGRS
ncbi:uncharacterized protein AB675_866 [Cyphellophora attinorum]|uniref:N-acetyltransferase domain-containing protein n=1 Tax=Cyphellophora attinorum TaxID=1664694 RepID=A0A0N0NS23_9EURO|nr:uncharacterized protein AB675_866 [Phialophora attinorum]KPI45758.1 hypothetical protein AB675_866 [Phialophora attinorum]